MIKSLWDKIFPTVRVVWDKIFYILFVSKPMFIGFLICFTVLVMSLLVYGAACRSTPYPSAKDISLYPLDRPIPTMPFELNIVKGDFNEKQISIVRKVVDEWEDFSKGELAFVLNEGWAPPEDFSVDLYSNYPSRTLWMRSGDDPGVVELFIRYSIVGDGFSVGNFILVVNDFGKIDDYKLYLILMHEIGHQLGMEHIKDNYPALMNIGGNEGEFSIYDKIMFCELYNCNFNDL